MPEASMSLLKIKTIKVAKLTHFRIKSAKNSESLRKLGRGHPNE